MRERKDHYFSAALANSQFADLEEPWEGEGALVVEASKPVDVLIGQIRQAILL